MSHFFCCFFYSCLHRGLHFRGEADDELERRNWLVRDAGTVHKDDTVAFSFGIRPKNECDLTGVSSLPFQVQVLFTLADGSQICRVTTVQMQLKDENEVSKIDNGVVATQAIHKATRLAKQGDVMRAQQELQNVRKLLGAVRRRIDSSKPFLTPFLFLSEYAGATARSSR